MAPGQPNGAPAVMGYPRQPAPQLPPPQALGPLVQHGQIPPRREATNEYAALFVALIGKPWHLPHVCVRPLHQFAQSAVQQLCNAFMR